MYASYEYADVPIQYFVTYIKLYANVVHAYPKSMCCRAESVEEMQVWLQALLQPLQEYAALITE